MDLSTNLSKDFAVLRLNGGTGALMAGVVATGILVYMAYKVFLWKREKMGAERRALQGEERVVWGNLGRIDQEDRAGVGRLARRPCTSLIPPFFLNLPMRTSVLNVEKKLPTTSSEATSSPRQRTPCRGP